MGGVSAPFGWKMLAFAFQQPFQLGLAVDLSPKGDFETRKVCHFYLSRHPGKSEPVEKSTQ